MRSAKTARTRLLARRLGGGGTAGPRRASGGGGLEGGLGSVVVPVTTARRAGSRPPRRPAAPRPAAPAPSAAGEGAGRPHRRTRLPARWRTRRRRSSSCVTALVGHLGAAPDADELGVLAPALGQRDL